MAVKVDKGSPEPPKVNKFPKLMRSDSGLVVLFTNKTTGTVLCTNGVHNDVGYHSCEWYPEGFVDFNESITIQNIPE